VVKKYSKPDTFDGPTFPRTEVGMINGHRPGYQTTIRSLDSARSSCTSKPFGKLIKEFAPPVTLAMAFSRPSISRTFTGYSNKRCKPLAPSGSVPTPNVSFADSNKA